MRPNEIKECFRKIEQEAKVNDISLKGLCAWPLIRSALYSEFLKSPPLESKSRNFPLSILLQRIIYYGINTVIIFKRKYFSERKSDLVETLVFGHSPHYTKVTGQNYRSDRIMEPVVSLLEDISYKKYVIGILPVRRYKDNTLSFRSRSSGGSVLLQGLTESGLLHVLEQYDFDRQSFEVMMSKPIRVFLGSYERTKKILEENVYVKNVFLSVWYSPIVMGITAAAKDKSIRIIDIQHGAEISGHAMYCDWTQVPAAGYQMVPNIFWSWDGNFERTINRSFSNNINHLSMSNCPTWLNFRMEQLSHTNFHNKADDVNVSYKYLLLFTLQPPCFDTSNRIPDFLIEFLEQNNPDVLVSIRRHPNDPGDMTELSSFQSRKFKTAYSVITSSEDLVNSLYFSTHHLTRFSSVCYEAENLGVPTLLFGPEAYEFYTTEIQRSRFHWTPGNTADLYSFLKESKVGIAKLATTKESLGQIQMLTGH